MLDAKHPDTRVLQKKYHTILDINHGNPKNNIQLTRQHVVRLRDRQRLYYSYAPDAIANNIHSSQLESFERQAPICSHPTYHPYECMFVVRQYPWQIKEGSP